ncbi:hypothetical protein [Clostridium baratii]|uniref:hypothetical protein n=1 Tax=Clostridium baratii TaxID=1561 RepID=UPI00098115B2|nr:hypothetical protein [Clostridium baratii]
MKEKCLFERLKVCNSEEEVKYEFAKFFKYKIDTRERIDLYSPEILFEFKYKINLDNVTARSKAIAQALYYIRRLKYGNDVRTPSTYICIINKHEALFVEVEELKDYFYKSKALNYDWDLAPSNPCRKLVSDLSNSSVVKELYVYHLDDSESEKEFISKLESYQSGEQLSLFGNKKEINENNFYNIFKYWESLFGVYVEDGRKSSEYFITDIEQGRTCVIDNTQVLFRMNSGESFTKSLPVSKYEHFWNVYAKVQDVNQIMAIRQKMDRMSEISLRRFTGEFFTPLIFAEKAIDYLGRVIGTKWWTSGKYRLWDMSAGTGNLEFLLPSDALKYCYISSLLSDDVEYCKKIYPDSTVFQYDYLNDDINILKHPDLLEKGIKYKLPQNLVEDLKDPDIKWILFFNPPYATSNNNARNKNIANKDGVSMTEVQKIMTQKMLGEVSRELMSQFLYRISHEFRGKDAYIGMFSKIKYMNATNDQKLRDKFFQYRYEKGFIFSSASFEGCKAKFPVGFIIWNMKQKIKLEQQQIYVDVYNNNVEKVGVKEIKVENKNNFLSKWIDREPCTEIMPPLSNAIKVANSNKDKRDRVAKDFIASFMCKGNDFLNQNYTALLSAPYVSAGALSITPNNFEKSMIVHTVRRLPKASWINDRDQLKQPIVNVLEDEEFVSNCVLWSLFSNSNTTASMSNVEYGGRIYRIKNELFPFTTDHMKEWNVVDPDIKTQIWAKNSERYAALWLKNHRLSKEGKELLKHAEKLYRFYYSHMNEVSWPKYKIYDWDIGWWQLRMSINEVGIGQEELDNVRKAHILLGEKIIKKIYEYKFIEPDMEQVN